MCNNNHSPYGCGDRLTAILPAPNARQLKLDVDHGPDCPPRLVLPRRRAGEGPHPDALHPTSGARRTRVDDSHGAIPPGNDQALGGEVWRARMGFQRARVRPPLLAHTSDDVVVCCYSSPDPSSDSESRVFSFRATHRSQQALRVTFPTSSCESLPQVFPIWAPTLSSASTPYFGLSTIEAGGADVTKWSGSAVYPVGTSECEYCPSRVPSPSSPLSDWCSRRVLQPKSVRRLQDLPRSATVSTTLRCLAANPPSGAWTAPTTPSPRRGSTTAGEPSPSLLRTSTESVSHSISRRASTDEAYGSRA